MYSEMRAAMDEQLNVVSMGAAAMRRGRRLRLQEETGMKINDGVKSFPDGHFAEIELPGTVPEKRIVQVFSHHFKDEAGKDAVAPYYLDDPCDPMSGDALLNEMKPRDLGNVESLMKDVKIGPCIQAVTVISADRPDRPMTTIVEAAFRMARRLGTNTDTTFVAREALRYVEEKAEGRRKAFKDLENLFSQDLKGSNGGGGQTPRA